MNFTGGSTFFAAALATFHISGVAAADGGRPVATIGTQAISAQDLDARTAEKLRVQEHDYELRAAELKINYERTRQAYLDQELSALIDERVLALEGAARKSTPAALNAAVKSADVTDPQVQSFYDSNKAQIRQPYESIAPKIKEFLKKQADQEARRRYLDSLRAKYQAVTILEPLREAVAATGPVRGPVEAPVTIIEFSDFQCPFCGQFAPTLHEILAKYPKQVRLVYRHLPVTKLHPNAEKAAEAAVCAQDQGKFWEMYDTLFAEQNALGVDALKEKAKRLGLDTAIFDECLDSGKSEQAIQADARAAEALGITGTPASFINGRLVNGTASVDQLSRIIDDELRRAVLTARR